jgi:hypothetical protein
MARWIVSLALRIEADTEETALVIFDNRVSLGDYNSDSVDVELEEDKC